MTSKVTHTSGRAQPGAAEDKETCSPWVERDHPDPLTFGSNRSPKQ